MLDESSAVKVCVRPEHITLHHENGLAARVKSSIFLGERYRLTLVTGDETEVTAYSDSPGKIGEFVQICV